MIGDTSVASPRSDDSQILRVEVRGHWSVLDLVRQLDAIDYLYRSDMIVKCFVNGYSLRFTKEIRSFLLFGDNAPAIDEITQGGLQVKSINYSSPGWQDLAGMGKGIEMISGLIASFHPTQERRNKRTPEVAAKKIELDEARQELLIKRIEIMRSVGFNKIEIEAIARRWLQAEFTLKTFVERKMIVRTTIKESGKLASA